MNRFFKMFVAAIMFSLLAFFVPFSGLSVAHANDSAVKKEFKLQLELVENDKPDEFSFRVKIDENPGLHGLKMELSYDEEKMMLAYYTGSSVLEDDLKLVTPVTEKSENGYAHMPFVFDYSTSDMTKNAKGTGIILLLRFKLKEGIKDGSHKVSFINTKAVYYDNELNQEVEYNLKIDALKINVLSGTVQNVEIYDGVDPKIPRKTLWIILISVAGGLVVAGGVVAVVLLIRKHKTQPKKVKGTVRSVRAVRRSKNRRIKKK
jgi:hypothetical protein